MASKKLVIRGGLDLNSVLSSGGSDPVLTRNPTTKEVGETTPLLVGLPTTLLQGYIYIGDNTNTAQARLPIGDINLTDLGLVTINDGAITDNKVSLTAAIAYSKLNLVNSIVNADIATAAAIVRSKLASGIANRVVVTNSSGVMIDANSITPNRVLISDSNGIPTDSGLTTTVLGYVDPTSSIQTQLNNRLSFSSSITPNEGDIVVFQSGVWNSFPRGSSGQYLTSTVGGLAWTTTPNGLPIGGVGNEILRKIDATDYNTEWHTLVIADLTDITANAAQVNELATGYYDATSSIQTQFSFKLNNALANNAMFVGNSSNQVSQLAPGSNGQVLTIVAGVPQWQTVSGTGTVTSVAFSGGSTGLTVTGSPITTSGTITLTGTLGTANGGTNITSYTTGDLPYASSSTVLSKLGIGTNGYVLTVSGGLPSWQPNVATTPLTTKGDIFIYSTTDDRLPVGTDGYHLTADSTAPTGLKWTAPVFNPFSDLNPILYNNADNTKLARLDVSSVTTGTTRVYTLPDFNGTIALLGSTNGAALSKADDTNVTLTLSAGSGTALLNATTITVGWTGTLAAARLNSNVVQAITNDTNVTGSISAQTLTLGWTGTLAYSRFVNGGGLSVVGRSANSSGVQADITGTTDQVLRVNGAGTTLGFGSIDLSKSATVGSSVLPVANGGTNISSYAVGDLIYASGSTTLSKLADVAVGSYLRSGGVTTAPLWSTVTLPNSATTGDLIYASGTNTYSNLAVGSATTVLHGGTTPSYSAVSLTADVTGILPIANGGTGSATQTAYLLASGGTASAANTFTHNFAAQTFTNTWTATANSQISKQFTDAITLRATTGDIATATYINPSFTFASTTQNPIGLNLDVNFVQTGGINTTFVGTSTVAGMTATTYTNVAPASTSGSGTGALFTVVVGSATSITSITPTTAGSGYKVNETITFNGSQFGSGSGSAIYTVRTVVGLSIGTTATAMRIGISGWNTNDAPKVLDFWYQGATSGWIGVTTSGCQLYDSTGLLALSWSNNPGVNIFRPTNISSTTNLGGATTFTSTFSGSLTLGAASTTSQVINLTGGVGTFTGGTSFASYYKVSSTSTIGTGAVTQASLIQGGTGNSSGNKATTGGTGTGLTVNVTASGGVITSINSFPARGTNYIVGDVITISGGTISGTFTVTQIDNTGSIIAFDDNTTVTDSKTNYTYASFYSRPTYTLASSSASTWLAYYNPTYTSFGSGTKGGICIVPTGTVSGIGTASPTGTVHIVGAGSIPTLKTVGVGTGTNYSYRAFQSDGTTPILNLQDNGNFSIPVVASLSGFGTSSQTSTLESGGSLGAKTTSVSTNTTLDVTYFTVRVDASGANRTITLPTASGCTGRIYVILKSDNSANTVTISTTAGGDKVINTQYSGYQVQSNGTAYNVIGSF